MPWQGNKSLQSLEGPSRLQNNVTAQKAQSHHGPQPEPGKQNSTNKRACQTVTHNLINQLRPGEEPAEGRLAEASGRTGPSLPAPQELRL